MAMATASRKERLEQLLNLAQAYQGWNRKRLAKELGRDTTRLVPESGLPKLDLLMDLARVLDWSVDDVANHLWAGQVSPVQEEESNGFAMLEGDAQTAQLAGRNSDAVRLARLAFKEAESGEERAVACIRESSGWYGLGRYINVLEVARRGLSEKGVSRRRRINLQVNLAVSYYSLWHLLEAKWAAQDLIQNFDIEPPVDRIERGSHAFAHYVRGQTFRRLMAVEDEQNEKYALLARQDLLVARRLCEEVAGDFSESAYYQEVAQTCDGGLLEVETALGIRTVEDSLQRIEDKLSGVVDVEAMPPDNTLESIGWWCIFGCNIALRHLSDPRSIQRHMALLTNKADEVAERLNNWSLRERVFTMGHTRRQHFADWTGVDADWTIDTDDIRVITGTMGRFPAFQPTGWQILESAKVVKEN